MFYILTALKCEASALSGLPGSIIVTGVGGRCTAALAKIPLTPEDRILNIGCAAGRITGGLYLANRIENAAAGKCFYPDIRSDSQLPEMKLVTSSMVVTEPEESLLYDMEAALICEWAMKVIPPSNICVLKAVSDDGTNLPSANDITQLIRKHLPEIKMAAEQFCEGPEALPVKTYPDNIADELKFSQYMRSEFAALRHYCEVSGRTDDINSLLEEMRTSGRIPARDKKAGKEILDEIFAYLR